MLNHLLQPIEKDLHGVHELITNQLSIKAGYVGSFAHLEFSLNSKIRPAMVILSSHMYGCSSEKVTTLASVIQFIYMASHIHQGISENDSDYIRGDSDPRDGSQFPVLVGDFLYGKFFTFLSNANIINLLHPLAEIICQFHEGAILRKKTAGLGPSSDTLQEIVRKETAGLFAGSCSLGARLAGASRRDQGLMDSFGYSFGMAYGLLEDGCSTEQAGTFLDKALAALSPLPDSPEKTVLEKLVHSLSGHVIPVRRMVI